MPEPIGRSLSIVLLGPVARDHPAVEEIEEQAQEIGDHFGVKTHVISGPYYEGGDERDLKVAALTKERDRALGALRMVLTQFQQTKTHDGMTHAPHYRATLDFPQMDDARDALAGGGN